jgi:hypothetical protein
MAFRLEPHQAGLNAMTDRVVQFSTWNRRDGSVFRVNAWLHRPPTGIAGVMAAFGFAKEKSLPLQGIARFKRDGAMLSAAEIDDMESQIRRLTMTDH